MTSKFSFLFLAIATIFCTANACTSFYCINQCGTSKTNKGYKFVLANNRDEDIYRLTTSAKAWPPRDMQTFRLTQSSAPADCDQSMMKPPFNVCAYGALDLAIANPPEIYSTWLGLNERGLIGNLLFYMKGVDWPGKFSRGIVVSASIMNSSWPNTEAYMKYLEANRDFFKSYNYVQAEMSPTTGNYDMYYFNNVQGKPHVKLNPNQNQPFIFGISNSNPEQQFNKAVMGQQKMKEFIDRFAEVSDKIALKNSLLELLQNTTDNYPDPNLEEFLGVKIPLVVRGISRVKADYGVAISRTYSRTSTIILIDYDDNVEYFEYNMSSWSTL